MYENVGSFAVQTLSFFPQPRHPFPLHPSFFLAGVPLGLSFFCASIGYCALIQHLFVWVDRDWSELRNIDAWPLPLSLQSPIPYSPYLCHGTLWSPRVPEAWMRVRMSHKRSHHSSPLFTYHSELGSPIVVTTVGRTMAMRFCIPNTNNPHHFGKDSPSLQGENGC